MASSKLGEREGGKCQVLISLHLCSTHPGPFQKNLLKRLELEEVGRTASACGPQRCPGDASGAGPRPSLGPWVRLSSRSSSSEGRAGTPGRVSAAAVSSELYPQIKKKKKKKGGKKGKNHPPDRTLASQPPSAILRVLFQE